MKLYLSVILILFYSGSAISQEPVSVLIVGNSLTYYNRLDRVIKDIIGCQNKQIKVNVNIQGYPGVSLKNHIMDSLDASRGYTESFELTKEKSPTVEIIESKCWDYLILQDRLSRDSTSYYELKKSVETCSTEVLYFEGYSTILWSDSIRSIAVSENKLFFNNLTSKIGGKILPVGEVFDRINAYSNNRAFWVYSFDGHPTKLGTIVIGILIAREILVEEINYSSLSEIFPEYKNQLYQIGRLLDK